MLRRALAAIALWSACQAGMAASADPAHVVTLVSGAVAAGPRALGLMDRLDPRATIRLEHGARLVVFRFRDAHEFTLAGPGSFAMRGGDIVRLGTGGSLHVKRMDPAFGSAAGGVRTLTQAGVTVRAGDRFGQDVPRRGEALAPSLPLFRWRARAPAGAYRFVLRDAQDNTLYEATPAGHEHTLPSTLLAPGAAYRWELSWHDRSGAIRLASTAFTVLSEADLATMERLRPSSSAPTSERRLFGLWLRSKGAQSLAEPWLEP